MTAAGDVVSSDDDDADAAAAAAAKPLKGKQQSKLKPQQEQADGKGDAIKYPPPPLSSYERQQQKRRAKLEKLLKRGKRVGQRMRKKLYEKLYGMDANHLKVSKGLGAARDVAAYEVLEALGGLGAVEALWSVGHGFRGSDRV
jgi:hypothetical protein